VRPLRVIGLDHVVLDVSDVERALALYIDELGLDGTSLHVSDPDGNTVELWHC